MNGFFKKDEKITYFKLMKLKLSRNEKRTMRRKVVRQTRRMRMRGRMGKM
jgi:hypothetical protein